MLITLLAVLPAELRNLWAFYSFILFYALYFILLLLCLVWYKAVTGLGEVTVLHRSHS